MSTTVLLNFNGTNGSATFTDSSSGNNAPTVAGNAQISTTNPKFGTGCCLLDGDGDYFYFDGGSDFEFGTGDFTIEFFAYFTRTAVEGIFDWRPSGTGNGAYPHIYTLSGNLYYYVSGADRISGAMPSLNGWSHIALCRSGTSTRLFVDGSQIGSTYSDSTNYLVGSSRPVFGVDGDSLGGNPLNGKFDCLRVKKGEALYTSNFTPPTAEFSESIIDIVYFNSLIKKQDILKTAEINSYLQKQNISNTISIDSAIVKNYLKNSSLDSYLLKQWQKAEIDSIIEKQGVIKTSGADSYLQKQNILKQTGFDSISVLRIYKNASFDSKLIYWYDVAIPIPDMWVSTQYRCYLTGSPDSLADLELIISSFQVRMGADPYRAYVSAVIPNSEIYVDEINLRPNGKILINKIYNYLNSDPVTIRVTEVAFDRMDVNEGAKSGATGTISGFENLTESLPDTIDLFDPMTRTTSNGLRRYRCRFDPRLRPLDTANINNESFVVDGIILIVNTKSTIMEISELL